MSNPAQGADLVAALSNGMADAVEQVGKATVTVHGRRRQSASGLVYAQGIVLTADHVLEREDELTITTPDGQTLPAQFAGRDPSSDLAILRVDNLNVAPAKAGEQARVGQLILAVGRPSSEGLMASVGVVSAVGGPVRSGRGAMLEQYIRTDATPYPGFSGGALIDLRGQVVGILTTGLVPGVTLAIPAAVAWRVAETLSKHGSIRRGYLGITSQPVQIPPAQRSGRTQEGGLLIMRVEEGSPADKGGLLMGDILVTLDGQPVADTDDLQPLLSGDRVGKSVPVEVIRGGALQTIQVTVGQRS